MRRILVVKLADLGDLLLCEPALRSLRAAYPHAEIDVLVPPATAELVRLIGHGLRPITFEKGRFDRLSGLLWPRRFVDAVSLARSLRRRRYSAVVLLHHLTTSGGAAKYRALARTTGARVIAGLDNGRGSFLTSRVDDLGFGQRHETEYMLDVAIAAGGVQVDSAPRFPRASVIGANSLPDRFVAIHPVTGSYSTARAWFPERWAAVAEGLERAGIAAVIVGASDASDAARIIQGRAPEAVDFTGRTSIAELAGIVSHASCVVGGDSFVGHLAAALGTPTVSVFGPSNADAWRPYGDGLRHQIAIHRLPCQPCIYTGFSLGRPMGCPDRTCLQRVGVDDVLSRVLMVCGAD